MGSGGKKTFSGSYEGTGAQLALSTPGFSPSYVKIVGIDNAGESTKTRDMADETYMVTYVTAAPDAGQELAGLTAGAGIQLKSDGFYVGTDGFINTSGNVYHFLAWE